MSVKKKRYSRERNAYSLLHISDDFLHFLNGLPRHLIVLGRRHGRKLNLLPLKLQLGALDGKLHMLDSLVAEALVHVLALRSLTLLAGSGDGGEFKGEGELEVGFGDDLGFLRVEFQLVLERDATVFDGIGIPETVREILGILGE